MKIKRYNVYAGSDALGSSWPEREEEPDGEFVLFSDVEALLASHAELVVTFDELLKCRPIQMSCEEIECWVENDGMSDDDDVKNFATVRFAKAALENAAKLTGGEA